MNANELRIGNIVEYYVDDYFNTNEPEIGGWIETTIDPEDILFLSSAEDEDYRPIPITPEWLERFGFRYLKSACWEYGSMRICDISDTDNVRFRIALAGHQLVVLKYVHELQNFHFVFTKKELV